MHFERSSFAQNKTDFDAPSSKECVIVVKNIPKCEPDLLEFYFENSKSGGAEGCVKDIKIVGANVAHVTFHTSEGLYRVYTY